MGKNVRINKDGVNKVFAEIAAKIEKTDQAIRNESAGKPASEVAPRAARAFKGIGVNLPDADIQAYARAVEAGEDFVFKLQ